MGDSAESYSPAELAQQWPKYLDNKNLCCLPQLIDGPYIGKARRTLVRRLDSSRRSLEQLCVARHFAMGTVMKTVWALLLGRYTGVDSVGFCFADLQNDGYTATLGFVSLEEGTTIAKLCEDLDGQAPLNQRYQQRSLFQVQAALSKANMPLLDSVLVLQQDENVGLEGLIPQDEFEVIILHHSVLIEVC
jgi:hypothetical protein